MARYTATVDSPRVIEDVFAYVADFSTTQEWDPGIAEGKRLDDGPLGVGSRFEIVSEVMRRKTTFIYEMTTFEEPRKVVLRGENATIVSLDTIEFDVTSDGGTAVTYDADLTLKGPLRLADPILKLAFGKIGDRAVEGLRKALGGVPATA